MDKPVSCIEWTPELPANKEIPYNHVLAETPFGKFEITWKGWKENDSPTVDETPWGDYFGAYSTVGEAKAACEVEYARRLGQCGVQAARAEGEPVGVIELSDYVQLGDDAPIPRRKGVAEIAKGSIQDLPVGTKLYTRPPAKVPEWVYDGYAVFSCLTDKAKARTSADNVSDTLDAVKAMLTNPPQTEGE